MIAETQNKSINDEKGAPIYFMNIIFDGFDIRDIHDNGLSRI